MPKFLLNQQGVIPLVVIVAAGIIGSSGVTVAASQKSLPGEALYPVKKVTENVRVAAAFSKQDKVKVHLDIAEEKVKEIEKLEERGRADKIAEAAQNLEYSQEQALELTETIQSEGGDVDELVERLEVQTNKQQVVLKNISDNIPQQVSDSLEKSLEQFREQIKVTVESDEGEQKEDSEQEEADSESSTPTPTPCPSPTPSEDENNYQEDEDTSTDTGEDENEGLDNKKYLYEDNDVEGVSLSFVGSRSRGYSQLQGGQSSRSSNDPCDNSDEYNSSAGSAAFDGGTGAEGTTIDDGSGPGGQPAGTPVGEPTNQAPTVKGVSTNEGLLQLILNALFQR